MHKIYYYFYNNQIFELILLILIWNLNEIQEKVIKII